MRRVFSVIGFSFLFTSFCCVCLGLQFAVWCAVIAFVCFTAGMLFRRIRLVPAIPVVLLCICLASVNSALRIGLDVQKTLELSGKTEQVTAQLISNPVRDSYYEYTFQTLSVGAEAQKQSFRFVLYSKESLFIEPYDQISGQLTFSDELTNKHFDYGKGIYLTSVIFSPDSVQVIHTDAKHPLAAILRLQKSCESIVTKEIGGDAAGLMNGLLFSDKSGMSDTIYENFRKCGLLHTTAVSGMHVSLLTGALFSVLLLLGFSRRKSAVVMIVFVLFYMTLIGFSYSVVRSGIMMITLFAAYLFKRQGDSLNALGLSALIIVLIHPYAAIDVSFLLSFFATLGMMLLFAPLSRFLAPKLPSRFCFAVLAPLVQTLCATVFILPIYYYFFGTVPLLSPIANLLTIPLITVAILLGLCCLLVFFIPGVSFLLFTATRVILNLVIGITDFLASLGLPEWNIGSDAFGLFLAASLLLIAAAYFLVLKGKLHIRRAVQCTAALCAVMLAVTLGANAFLFQNSASLFVLDSGEALCAVVQKGNEAVVIGGDDKSAGYQLDRLVQKKNIVKITAWIVPFAENGDFHLSESMLKYKPEQIYVSGEENVNANAQPLPTERITLFDGCFAQSDAEATALHLQIQNVSILFVDRETKTQKISFSQPDILVLTGLYPQEEYLLQPDCTLLCNESDRNQPFGTSKTIAVHQNGNVETLITAQRGYRFKKCI